ncbi:MAG: hypothetical protein AAGA54_15960 [Myxococcota bacterium]
MTMLLAGCPEPQLTAVDLVRPTEWVAVAACEPAAPKVDVLFVVDDSGSMLDTADALAENLSDFGHVYARAGLDVRIAVTRTSVPSSDCAADDVALVASSCRDRLEDFVAPPSHESDSGDAAQTCARTCAEDAFTIAPSPVHGDDTSRVRPWIAPDTVEDLPAALACLGQVGVSGCDAESPLAAVLRVLDRTDDPADPAFGFVRPDAALAVVILTDEDDCSRPDGALPLPVDGTRSSACWRAGSRCERDGEPWCEPNPGGALLDLDAVFARLDALEADKQRFVEGQRVFVSAVAGVPRAFPEEPLRYAFDTGTPFEAAFGVGPGCTEPGMAAPPVRVRAVAEAYAAWNRDLVSTCGETWLPALACIPGGPPQLERLCFEADAEDDAQRLAETCILVDDVGNTPVALPTCDEVCDDEGCTQAVPPDAEACVIWVPQGCEDRAEARLLRRDPASAGRCVEVRCGIEL